MQKYLSNQQNGFPALMIVIAAYGESCIMQSSEQSDWQLDWDNASSQDDAISVLHAGLDLLTERLHAMRRGVIDWGCSLWRDEPLVEGSSTSSQKPGFLEELPLLDALVFLMVACRRYPPLQKPPFALFVRRVDDLYEGEEAFYRYGSWRLIPFNNERRAHLENIPSAQWYLFPWYEEWHDLSPQSLDVLIESLAGHPTDSKTLPSARLEELRIEIEQDPDASIALAKHVILARELPAALAQAYALRLSLAADEAGLWQDMPSVESAATQSLDLGLLVQAILHGESAVEWRLQAAFMAKGLSRQERLECLRKVEEEVTDAMQSSGITSLPTWLASWIQGSTDDAALVRHIAAAWNEAHARLRIPHKQVFSRETLVQLLASGSDAAQVLAEDIAAKTGQTATRQPPSQTKRTEQAGWLGKLFSLFKVPVLTLGTVAASVLLFLIVFHQQDDGATPILVEMQVFGRSELRTRIKLTPLENKTPTIRQHGSPPDAIMPQSSTSSRSVPAGKPQFNAKPLTKTTSAGTDVGQWAIQKRPAKRNIDPPTDGVPDQLTTQSKSKPKTMPPEGWSTGPRPSSPASSTLAREALTSVKKKDDLVQPKEQRSTKNRGTNKWSTSRLDSTTQQNVPAAQAPMRQPGKEKNESLRPTDGIVAGKGALPAQETTTAEERISRPPLSPPFELQDGDQLESGDYYQVRLSVDRDAHLYLLMSSGNQPPVLLLQDTMRAGEARNFPEKDQLFQLDQAKRTEWIYALLSERELPVQETLNRGLKDGKEETLRQAFPKATIRAFRLEHR